MTRPARLLLFDLDGTLLDTGGAGQAAMRRVGRKLFGDGLDFDAVQFGGLLDPLIFAQAAAAGGLADADSHQQRFHDAYLAELAQALAAVNPRAVLPGIAGLLDTVASAPDAVLGLLTGNYTRAAPIKLRHGGIDPDRFVISAFGDQAPTRAELVALAIERFASAHGGCRDPQHVIVIGDTPRDIDCAKANGCHAFAVATGRFGVDELRDAGADTVVADLSDPSPLVKWLA